MTVDELRAAVRGAEMSNNIYERIEGKLNAVIAYLVDDKAEVSGDTLSFEERTENGFESLMPILNELHERVEAVEHHPALMVPPLVPKPVASPPLSGAAAAAPRPKRTKAGAG